MTRFVLQLLDFFAQYARQCLLALGTLLLTLFLAYSYQEYQVQQTQRASLAYHHLTQSAESTAADYQAFIDGQPQTIFTTFAWMKLAKMQASTHDFSAADHALTQALSQVSDTKLRALLMLRQAKLSLLADKPQQAIDRLKMIDSRELAFVRDLTKIDAYIGLHDLDQAQTLADKLQETQSQLQPSSSQQDFVLQQMLTAKHQRLQTLLTARSAHKK